MGSAGGKPARQQTANGTVKQGTQVELKSNNIQDVEQPKKTEERKMITEENPAENKQKNPEKQDPTKDTEITAMAGKGKPSTKNKIRKEKLPEVPDEDHIQFDYPMKNRKALIFNINNIVEEGFQSLDRTDKDISSIKHILKKLNFKVDLHENKKKMEILKILESERGFKNLNTDCFICIFVSRRDDGVLCATDKDININELLSPFNDNDCLALRGKPKLFFIQECRGKKDSSAIEPHMLKPVYRRTNIEPVGADVLVAFATGPGYRAHRETDEGSWLIKALAKELKDHSSTEELLHMLLHVNQRVADEYETFSDDETNLRITKLPRMEFSLKSCVYFF